MNQDILNFLKKRYFLQLETKWIELVKRVSRIYPKSYNLINAMKFIPGSPTLMNANTKGEKIGTLSSCFPMGIEDNIESIFDSLKESGIVTRYGGGVGYDFSSLRSNDEGVKGIGGKKSSGPLPFINIFNSMLDGVQQGGCFIGDTLIATINGAKKIKDIKEGEYVYSYKKEFTIQKASKSFITKRKAEVWKLITDKNITIYATPDHKFMVRWKENNNINPSPKYIKLKDLKIGTPLMPLTIYNNKDKKIILQDGKDTRLSEHIWKMKALGYDLKNKHIHHKDHNHFNNNLDNLEILSPSEHSSYHNKYNIKNNTHPFLNLSEKSKIKRINNFSKTYANLDEETKKRWNKKNSEALIKENKKRIENGTHNWIINNPNNDYEICLKAKKSRIANSIWKVIGEGYKPNSENWEDVKLKVGLYNTCAYKLNTIIKTFGSFDNALNYANERNHKVVSIKFSHYEDVYDIEVENTHNFVVCNKNMTKGVVVHNSRRGAGMSQLSINHPNILDFIEAKKDYRNNNFKRFNFSVRIPDNFYTILENTPNTIHEVYNVVDKKPKILKDKNGESVTVKDLWDKIIHHAWLSAEPGIFNETIAFNQCTVTNVSKQVLSNPCFTGNTLIAVAGVRNDITIKDLANDKKSFLVYSARKKKRLNYKNEDDRKVEIKKAVAFKTGNKEVFNISLNNGDNFKCTKEHLLALYRGDYVKTKDSMGKRLSSFYTFKEKNHININSFTNGHSKQHRMIYEYYNGKIKNLINIVTNKKKYFELKFTDVMKNPNKEEIDHSFYSNDIYVTNIEYVGMEDVYDLSVEDNNNFYIYTGKNKRGDKRGILVHNCSEFISIPYSACNLGSLNLAKFVRYGKFDWKAYEKAIEIATIFLDNVIDKNTFPLDKIKKVTENIRPIGLGIMGLAHMFYLLGLPYNSLEAKSLFHEIMHYITLKSMKVSVEIAKKKGKYKAFDYNTYINANKRFFQYSKWRNINVDKLKEDIKNYGIRNHSNTSIAPTGSISFISNVSSGIEPVYALTYIRKIENLNNKFEKVYISDPVFEHHLNKYHKKNKKKIIENVAQNKGSCKNCEYLSKEEKNIFQTAMDLTPMEHLDILEVACKNTSLSVSKTINTPKDITKKEISDVYIEAHKRNIIGVTVYRNGSREGVLITDNESAIPKTKAPKRPNELLAEVHHFVIKKQKYYVVVGMYENEPYEVFTDTNYSNDGEVYIPKHIINGKVIKECRGKYILVINEKEQYILTSNHSDDNAEALTRMISTSLRHGTDVSFITHQLQKCRGDLISFSKALARTLKKYIIEGTKVYGAKCKNCGSKNLIYSNNCPTCLDCKYSDCS